MIIAVDFDGTCVTHEFPRVGAEIGAAEVLKDRPDASIFETYVIYDGSMGRADKVKSMYRYNR